MTKRSGARIALLATAAALCAALPATASAELLETGACDDSPLSQPFAPWGDHAHYKLAPGGDFESGTAGWSLRNAAVVSGSSPYAATGRQGSRSVSIKPGGSVTSPATCVNIDYPTARFFAKSSGGLLGLLPAMKVDVLYRDGALGIIAVPAGVVTPSSRWNPTLQMLTHAALGATLNGGEAPVALRFTSLAGTWTIDDVFVDPYRRS